MYKCASIVSCCYSYVFAFVSVRELLMVVQCAEAVRYLYYDCLYVYVYVYLSMYICVCMYILFVCI